MSSIPSYITRSCHGVYYFQKRVDEKVQSHFGISQSLLRKSLKTKDKREAVMKASFIQAEIYRAQNQMTFHTFEQYLDYLLNKGDYTTYELEIIDKRKEFYLRAEEYLESPEPKSTELPEGCYSKRDMCIDAYGMYDASIILYFINDVLRDRGLNVGEYEKACKLGLAYDEFVDAQQHHLSCEEYLESKKHGLSTDEFVEMRRQVMLNNLGVKMPTSPHQSLRHEAPLVVQNGTNELAIQQPDDKALSDLVKEYIEEKEKDGLAVSSLNKYRTHLSLLLKVLPNGMTGLQLEKTHLRDFRDAIYSLPKNINQHKIYKNKSIAEIRQMSISANEKMTTRTQNDHLQNVKTFFDWTELNDYTQTGIQNVLKPFAKTKSEDSSGYKPFTNEQVISIFSHDIYQKKQFKPEHIWKYWIPLIAIFTGARIGEICQLDTDDIKEQDDIHYISINENGDGDKSVKTQSSVRDVPIHEKLIELGFLDYVKQQRKQKSKKLFPSLRFDDSKNTHGSDASKWFSRHLRNVGVKTDKDKSKLVFHSLRKTFVNYFYQNEDTFSEHHIGDVIGHKNSKQITFGTYADKLNLRKRKEIIDAYEMDIGL